MKSNDDILKVKEDNDLIFFDFEICSFSNKHLSSVADTIYKYIFKKKGSNINKYIFNLSQIEWIGHEELVFLSALFHFLQNNSYDFYIKLKGTGKKNKRQALQVLQLWNNWEIYSFLPYNNQGFLEYEKYFDIDNKYIEFLKLHILGLPKINDTRNRDVYGFTNVTPFYPFEILPNIDERLLSIELEELHSLDEYTKLLLNEYHNNSPYINKTLSRIISKEFFENSIEHAYDKNIENKSCFFGISLKNRISKELDDYEIDNINEENFNKEAIPESLNFFNKNGRFINQSFLQYTFLDFGQGIPKTLKDDYEKNHSKISVSNSFNLFHEAQNEDTRILEYAFNYQSSRHPIDEKYLNKDSISRGLFDVLSIVQRYNGLIIARSNYGKILFDFSEKKQIKESVYYFEKEINTFFPGTILTLFFPESFVDISYKSIKPEHSLIIKGQDTNYLSIQRLRKEIENSINTNLNQDESKSKIYNLLFAKLDEFLDDKQNQKSIIYIDFQDSRLDYRITKKILFYLASDYRINDTTNAIIINPPDKDIVKLVQYEISKKENVEKFFFHPIPCIYQDKDLQLNEIIWLGVKNNKDQDLFNTIIEQEEHDIRKNDFENPDDVLGNLFSFDKHGNLVSNLKEYSKMSVEALVAKNILQQNGTYYLSSGNYYQSTFISFLETLQDDDFSLFLGNLIVKRILKEIITKKVNVIISITLSSQLLSKALLSNIKLLAPEYYETIRSVRLSNYNSFESEDSFQEIEKGDIVLLVCDVISTGYLVYKLNKNLKKIKAELYGLASIVDTRIPNNEISDIKCYFEEINDINIESLYTLPLKKIRRDQIKNFDSCNIVRINPITNSINTLSKSKSLQYKIIYPDSEKVFEYYPQLVEYLRIGCFYYNNVFHSYYFETHKLLKTKLGEKIVYDLIQYLIKEESLKIDEIEYLFYPIYSGVEIEHDIYRTKIFKNHNIKVYPIARYITPYGWRFSFPPKYLNDITNNKNIFIIDDGSVSGTTITQMIDEICFLKVKSITFLSIFGRLEDYQREFFSRIENVITNKNSEPISIKVYFGMNWNIPVYTLGVKNPFYSKKEKLEKYLSNSSIPPFIKNIITQRNNELKLYLPSRTSINYESNEMGYLPRIKIDENFNKIPYSQLFIVRDWVGKIASYRFYSEYFVFFNDFINFYNLTKVKYTETRYQRIELLLGVIIHEPHLSDTIREILPDINEKLIEFINSIVINKKLKLELLYYKWTQQSLIRLLFILNKNNYPSIISEDSLTKIFNFCEEDETLNSLNYVFYSLINSIPMSKEDILKKEIAQNIDTTVKTLISNSKKLNTETIFKLKQFSSFLTINPWIYEEYNEKTSINGLVSFYMYEKNIQHHNECLSSSFGRLIARLDDCQQCLLDNIEMYEEIYAIRIEWDKIRFRIELFLKYMSNLELFSNKFFNGKLYYLSHKNDYCFQSILNDLNEILYSGSKRWNERTLKDIDTRIKYLLRYLVNEESVFVQLFTNYETQCYRLWNKLLLSIDNIKFIEKTESEVFDFKIRIHYLIVKDVLFANILTNFRHASKELPIFYKWINSNNELTLEIENTINKDLIYSENGNPVFKYIEDYYNFSYKSFTKGDSYIQILTFKI